MPEVTEDASGNVDRRSLIKKGAVAGAIAWTTPVVLTKTAHAQVVSIGDGPPTTLPAVVPGPAGFPSIIPTGRGAVRFRSENTGGEVFLGTSSLGEAANRVEAPATWANGTYPISFSWNGSSLSATGNGANLSFGAFTPCTSWNRIQIFIQARANSATTALNNVVLNGTPLGNFGPVTHTPADPADVELLQWTISGNFAAGFTLTGDLVVNGWSTGGESNRLDLTVGCV